MTGQAAWYDLRVRIEKVDEAEAGETTPRFAPLTPPASLPERPAILRYGRNFSRAWRRAQTGKGTP